MTRAIRLYEGLGYRRDPAHGTDSGEHYGLAVERPLRALAYRLDLAPRPAIIRTADTVGQPRM